MIKKNATNILKNFNKQKVKILLPIFLLIFIFIIFGVSKMSAENSNEEIINDSEEKIVERYPLFIGTDFSSPNLDVNAAISLYFSEEKGNKILYREKINDILPIASISKLITALVAIENYNLNNPINVTEQDIVSRTEFRDFRAWEYTTIEDIIYQMLIESNNSGAFALALISDRYKETEGDPVKFFVEEMNAVAKKIGLKDTVFINPSGLDKENNYNASTAKEVALMARYIIKNNSEIFEISTMPFFDLYSFDQSIYYTAINTNNFLHNNNKNWQKHIVGGKTGFTRFANGCLLLVLEDPNSNGYIINVVLGAEDRFKEMEKLIDYIYQNYQF